MNLRKDFFGYYVYWGSEKKEDWLKILNDLIGRGLKRLLLIISTREDVSRFNEETGSS
ncbi:hypothetical protein [Thermodesulfovibrio thiophilus]|uniref:hypothetical protein n=1 Tax=Thermodesulfovibrio thiophilus TaxID=340095 RepID=UPI00235376B4|nr:hypothetical protein [Thermodesulfovibrio thiophilus]